MKKEDWILLIIPLAMFIVFLWISELPSEGSKRYEVREQFKADAEHQSIAAEHKESVEKDISAPPEQPQEKVFIQADIELDAELQQWIYDYCISKNISPSLVMAIIEKESDCDSSSVGDSGESIGLMQVQSKWHNERIEQLNVTNLEDPQQNIMVGVDYLIELFSINPEVEWVLNAYNGGQAYADRIQNASISTDYSRYILARASEIERMIRYE